MFDVGSGFLLRICVSILLALSVAACGDGRAKEGESCDVAADCEGDLVCALTAADSKEHQCSKTEDTFAQENCVPGADLTMVCELIQKQPAGGACNSDKHCKDGLFCDLVDPNGTDAVCTKR